MFDCHVVVIEFVVTAIALIVGAIDKVIVLCVALYALDTPKPFVAFTRNQYVVLAVKELNIAVVFVVLLLFNMVPNNESADISNV